MGHSEHREQSSNKSLVLGILTVSDSRNPQNDETGQALREWIQAAGYVVGHYSVVPDEPLAIRQKVLSWSTEKVDAILVNGGTGVGPRDRTEEALRPMMDRVLSGFGELFRALSFQEIGSGAILSRAGLGVLEETVVAWLPGSPKAVALAWKKILLPELAHVCWEVQGRT